MPKRGHAKKPIVLIHGVNSDGSWQNNLDPVLGKFFDPIKVRYPQYKSLLGALYVVCEPGVLLLAVTAGAGLWFFGVALWISVLVALLLVAAAFLPLSVAWRRHKALRIYHDVAAQQFRKTPHVIAHSFGTYLTARLLEETPSAYFDRVILVGCVLPQDYNWHRLIGEEKVAHVRNEFTNRDWVGLSAKLAGGLHSRLGNAGTHGLSKDFGAIHRLRSPGQVCVQCAGSTAESGVHDVDCSSLGHSGAFVGEAHAWMWWLPFLWGNDPGESRKLLRFCELWSRAIDRFDRRSLLRLQRTVQTHVWQWCHHQSIWAYLTEALRMRGHVTSPDLIMRAFNIFAQAMATAKANGSSSEMVRFLDPHAAVNKAVFDLDRKAT